MPSTGEPEHCHDKYGHDKSGHDKLGHAIWDGSVMFSVLMLFFISQEISCALHRGTLYRIEHKFDTKMEQVNKKLDALRSISTVH